MGFRVHSPDELAAHWREFLDSPTLRNELSQKVNALVEEQRQAFGRTLQVLLDAVDAVANRKAR